MAGFLIGLFFLVLLLLCGFLVLLILMQRPSANAGMGAALGGGAAEQAFGGETGNVLTRWTVYAIVGFFVISLGLYLSVIATTTQEVSRALPELTPTGETPAEEAPVAPAENVITIDSEDDLSPERFGQLLQEAARAQQGADAAAEGTTEATTTEGEAILPPVEVVPGEGNAEDAPLSEESDAAPATPVEETSRLPGS